MNGRNREILAHVAVALRRYEKECGHEGVVVPPELPLLRGFLVDCAQRRPEVTEGAAGLLLADGVGMTENPLLTRREAASALRCSTRTVDRLVGRGALVGVKVEGSTRIRRVDLDAYIAALAPGSFRETITQKDTAC